MDAKSTALEAMHTWGWLWYSPASKEQTIQDCQRMKHKKSADAVPPPSPADVLPEDITGWGWSEWSRWLDGGCPDICGRRCRKRTRYCHGPYLLICKGRGRGDDFENCPALEDDNGDNDDGSNGFQRRTTVPDNNYNQINNAEDLINMMSHHAAHGGGSGGGGAALSGSGPGMMGHHQMATAGGHHAGMHQQQNMLQLDGMLTPFRDRLRRKRKRKRRRGRKRKTRG